VAKYQIHLAAFLCIPVSERLERCVGKHPEKLWVKIPNYFCLSTYLEEREEAGSDNRAFLYLYGTALPRDERQNGRG
jgi:hypothetical protein